METLVCDKGWAAGPAALRARAQVHTEFVLLLMCVCGADRSMKINGFDSGMHVPPGTPGGARGGGTPANESFGDGGGALRRSATALPVPSGTAFSSGQPSPHMTSGRMRHSNNSNMWELKLG